MKIGLDQGRTLGLWQLVAIIGISPTAIIIIIIMIVVIIIIIIIIIF